MVFYFYANKNIVFDYLSRNIIAPDSVVRDIKRNRTISTAADCFLFVTHKKLNRQSREQGIAEPEFVYPVTLEISEQQEDDGQAILVSLNEDATEYNLAKLFEYDPKKHIGAYLLGEIPLSRVDRIYFDTQDDQEMFSRPSPDYWYPTNKFALLPEDFSEELTTNCDEDKIIAASGQTQEEIKAAIRIREKKRAALLNLINGTNRWQYDRFVFNIDSTLQQVFGVNDDDLSPILPHYVEAKEKENAEHVFLMPAAVENSKELNQVIYYIIQSAFIEQPYNTQKQPEQLIEVLHSVCDKITADCEAPEIINTISSSFADIVELISDKANKYPEDILAEIPKSIDVLKALLFVARTPNNYDLFLESLDAYHADLLTKRRAMVLWGYLNGLYGMPGEGFNKDNQSLWQFIEATVYRQEEKSVPSLVICLPSVTITDGSILGIALKEERIVTAGEIREAILASPKEKLTEAFYKKLFEAAVLEAGSKKKAEAKGYTHYVASVTLPEIKRGEELNTSVRRAIEHLHKDCKTTVPNKEKLFKDYVENDEKFSFVFEMDSSFWETLLR